MRKFLQWAKETKKDMSFLEDQKRTGLHTPHPEGYVASQYPDGYFAAGSATGLMDAKNQAKIKEKKG